MNTRTELLAARAARLATEAADALVAGFKSEAARKRAIEDASRSYEYLREIEGEALRVGLWNEAGTEYDPAVMALLDAMPFGLHQFRAKHAAALASRPAFVAEVEALVALRAEIKAATIEAKPVREDHPVLVAARADIEAIIAKRTADYQNALDLGRIFAGLPVSVHRVYCGNYAGTSWVRYDWYLHGRRVAQNIVLAAYDALVREGTIVEGAA